MIHLQQKLDVSPRGTMMLSRRDLLGYAATTTGLFLPKAVLAQEQPGVLYEMVEQSSGMRLPVERLNKEIDGLPGALRNRSGSTLMVPDACFGDLLKPSENWNAAKKNATEFGLNLGTFCTKNSEHGVVRRLDAGAKSAKCVLELLKQVVAQDVAMEVLQPLGGAVNMVLLVLIIEEYRNYRIDKEMYTQAVNLADRISSTAAHDSGSYLFRSYYLSDDSRFLEEKIFFQGSNWEKGHPLWTARYKKMV